MEGVSLKETPKIGVFVCHCGTGISKVVKIPEILRYAKGLPGVTYVEETLHYCSDEGRNRIKDAIKKHNLNRVVIAACTPITYEPLFEATVEEAGLNKNLLQMANIREQCAWILEQEPEEATEKAKDTVRMAVAIARVLEPQKDLIVDVEPSTLVVGGGIAGMTSALNLANQGFKVYLIEKEPVLGGMLNNLHKLYLTDQVASDVLEQVIKNVEKHDNISLFTSTTVKDVKGYIGNFDVTILKDKVEANLKVGTIIVATGADVLKPVGLYRYGDSDKVITHLELERMMKEGQLNKPKNVVMIQCVGSREDVGRTYCSRICCMTAIKNAALIKEIYPEAGVYILYRDLQTYGKENEDYHLMVRDRGVRFIEYTPENPPEVSFDPASGMLKVKVYPVILGEEIEIESDLVVLSTPLIQHQTGKELSRILGVPLSSDEFFLDAHTKLSPVDFPINGIYVCGTAESPKSIDESISQAYAAASRAAIPMSAKHIRIKPITAFIEEEKCVGCKICVELCPYEAYIILEEGIPKVIEALCQGCGICAAACPERAISMKHFKNEHILAEIKAAFTR